MVVELVPLQGELTPRDYCEEDLARDSENFIMHLAQKGRRPTTLRTYREAIRSIWMTFVVNGLYPDPRTLSGTDFELLRCMMTVCDNSKKLYMVVLGRFVEYLTGHNPRKDAELLWNDDDKRRKFISAEEFKVMMFDSTPEERLVLTLGAYMGLRRSEIAGIKLSDIKDGHLTVRGKGHGPEGKVSRMLIPVQVRDAISRYAPTREGIILRSGSCDNHLLLRGSAVGCGLPFSSGTVANVVSKVAKRNGVDMTAHSLRRLYATPMYDGGVDLNTLRLMMRHANVSTTLQCYIQAAPAKFDEARGVLAKVLG